MRRILPPCMVLFFFFLSLTANAQVDYPYPVKKIRLSIEDTVAQMAYMDIQPANSNGKTIVLLHGKNFNGYYWKEVIAFLVKEGYRVIVPDQIGWGQTDKPVIYYSFHLLADNTRQLLDSLQVSKIILIGHSMGGMLAARFTMMYPQRVEKLVLEDPIGLEDYKRFVPYQPTKVLIEKERRATYESYKKYQQTYYPEWKPEYEQYVQAQAEILKDRNFPIISKVNALTYQMIYHQPVCYEWDRIAVPTLLMIGELDRTVVGKDQLTDEQKQRYGNYPALGKKTQQQIPNCKLVILPGIGHIPHVQDVETLKKHLLGFVK